MAGLNAALKAIVAEGLKQVYKRHAVAARAVRTGVRAMGIQVLAKEKNAAPISTCLVFPEPVDWTALASKMFLEHDIALASGFRIGTMGQSACSDHVLAALTGLERALMELGHSVTSGVEEAQEVFSSKES